VEFKFDCALRANGVLGVWSHSSFFDMIKGALGGGFHACGSVGVRDWSRTDDSGPSEKGREKRSRTRYPDVCQ
jgi:hypothetical protein